MALESLRQNARSAAVEIRPVVERVARARVFGKSPLRAQLRLGERIWKRLPPPVTSTPPIVAYGRLMNALVRLEGDRRQFFGTYFLRNRPQLELMRGLVDVRRVDRPTKIAVLGCSLGAEVYSIAWSIRSEHPQHRLVMNAVDISREALEIAREGVYSQGVSEFAMEPICERMTDEERRQMFDDEGRELRVKSSIKEGIRWHLGDAGDPRITDALGRHDIVVANDFLCHMRPPEAERCLRNIARMVDQGGYLVVAGVDVDVRSMVAKDLGWAPVEELIEEIHEGDRSLRQSWPWRYWGLEPFDRKRRDWKIRYASVFQVGGTT